MKKKWYDDKIKIIFPKRKHLTLDELDKIPYYDENNNIINNLKNERLEQFTTTERINPNDIVLELGGRYGLTACCVNNKLENPRNHVVIEPDTKVIESLILNRKTHLSKFTIINAVISKKKLKLIEVEYYSGFANRTIEASKDELTVIKNYTLEQIVKITKLNFNTLVIDCEGCFCNFFNENYNYIKKNISKIMYEKDYPNLCDYENIKKELIKLKFKCVQDQFYQVWIKE